MGLVSTRRKISASRELEKCSFFQFLNEQRYERFVSIEVARWLHAILINVDFIPWLLAYSFISILDEALSILYDDEIFPKFCVNKRTTLFLNALVSDFKP